VNCDIERIKKEVSVAYLDHLPCLTQYSQPVIIATTFSSIMSPVADNISASLFP
jgi:hypothetical protein